MKLFYSKGACSLAPHIVMSELNMVYETEVVDLKNKTCASGDYLIINPKGSVPALKMDDNSVLTESAVIVQYLADQKPESGLMPKFGTIERYRCQEWLNFIATEIHKNYSPLFAPFRFANSEGAQNEVKAAMVETLKKKIALVSEKLGNNDYVMGKQFTVADAYLFTVLSWSKYVGVDLSAWSNVPAYLNRVGERPAVIKAMKEEGLL